MVAALQRLTQTKQCENWGLEEHRYHHCCRIATQQMIAHVTCTLAVRTTKLVCNLDALQEFSIQSETEFPALGGAGTASDSAGGGMSAEGVYWGCACGLIVLRGVIRDQPWWLPLQCAMRMLLDMASDAVHWPPLRCLPRCKILFVQGHCQRGRSVRPAWPASRHPHDRP